MGVILGQEIVESTHLAHQREQVRVIEKEDMQPHLDVVAIRVHPAAHLSAHERTSLIEIHLMACIHQIHSSGEASQPRTHNRDPHRHQCNCEDSMN